MKSFEFELMMDGLIATLQEKLCVGVFSVNSAECQNFIDFITDIEEFWNGGLELSTIDFNEKIYEVLDRFM
jgi:hypothetical protein